MEDQVKMKVDKFDVSRPKSKKHYYIVSLRAIGQWANDLKYGLYISRILRAVSKDEAVGLLCAYVKDKHPKHSIYADGITCEAFNFANPNLALTSKIQ